MFCCKKLFKAAKSFDLRSNDGNDNGSTSSSRSTKLPKSLQVNTINNNHIHQHSFRRRSETEGIGTDAAATAATIPTTNAVAALPRPASHTHIATEPHFADDQFIYNTSAANNNDTVTTIASLQSLGSRSCGTNDAEQSEDSDAHSEPTPIDLNPPTAHANVRKEGIISEPAIGENGADGSGTGGPLSRGRSIDLGIPVFGKSAAVEELIRRAIGANDFLNNMMDAERLRHVVGAMRSQTYDPDSRIIVEGEQGDHFYIAEAGEFEVLKAGVIKSTFGAGVVFGELAILYKARRFASIRAMGPGEARVWQLERQVFQKIMISTGCQEREQNIAFLGSVPVLKGVAQDVLDKMVDLLKREFYVTGSTIICQGDPGDKFYIIRGGRAKVVKRNSETGESAVVGYLKRGDYFGEHALIHQDKRLASIISQGPGTECLTLDRIAFNKYLGLVSELKNAKVTNGYTAPVRPVVRLNPAYAHLQLDDLTVIGTLGVGGFGRVELVQCAKTGETFALKSLKKHDVVSQGQVQHAYCEKEIMAMCETPFVVKLFKTFRNTKHIYFLMEPCLGGDVWTQLQQHKQFAEPVAQFVVGCVVEAIEYLHTRNIIYRDLKPENLMVDAQGYVKLVDFGFAKIIQPRDKTWTFSGTPEYVAPEIILNKGHDRAVDYWALGVLVHELLVGKPPFRGKDHMRTYNAILRGIDAVRMPARIPRSAQSLIRDLCRQIPTDRIGYQKKGIQEIKAHAWFAAPAFDWRALRARSAVAPLQRPIESAVDLQNFEVFAAEREEPPDETSGWDVNF